MTLDEVYLEKITLANKMKYFSRFIFEFQGKKYFVEWRKMWSEPVEIVEL